MALAVLGAIPSSSAISALVRPSEMSRATANSRAVSGRHGSSIDDATARHAGQGVGAIGQRAAVESGGDRPDLDRRRAAPRRSDSDAHEAGREVESGPGGLPDPALASQPSTAACRARPGDPRRPRRPARRGRARGRARRRRPRRCRPGARRTPPARPPPRSDVRPPGRPHAGHDERRRAAIARRRRARGRARPGSARSRPPGRPPSSATSASPQSGGRISSDRLWLHRRTRRPCCERASAAVEVAAAHRDVADDPARHLGAPPTPVVRDRLAGQLVGVGPVVRRPMRPWPTSPP